MLRTPPFFVFMGSPDFAVTILEGLLAQGWKPALVVTETSKPVGRRHTLTPTPVDLFARQQQLPVSTPATKAELLNRLRDLTDSLELILVAAYGRLLPADVLDLPRYGAINVHASLLPKYRGASPIQAAIVAGETETGITLMQITAGLDTGPILAQFPVPILPTDSTATLTQRLAQCTVKTMVPALESYLLQPTPLTSQIEAQATYTTKITKKDGRINIESIDPIRLDRLVRAYTPWPSVYTDQFGTRLQILAGTYANAGYTITRLQWAGKLPVDGQTFARAYPDVLTKLPPSITLGATTSMVP
ncbi:methionyl-tRNA formyltransferase [Candidatus Berkelbacteria bacterium]|nr:methionyl-tRNA formyltransferase [Candidatus Berkelbacteria bacterium]